MNLRAWFDPKKTSDLRQSLIERQALGTWRLEPFDSVPERKLFRHVEELRLADGSVLQVSAMCDCTFAEPSTTLSVRADTSPLFITSALGVGGLTATVATGKGGFLAFQFWFDRHEQKG